MTTEIESSEKKALEVNSTQAEFLMRQGVSVWWKEADATYGYREDRFQAIDAVLAPAWDSTHLKTLMITDQERFDMTFEQARWWLELPNTKVYAKVGDHPLHLLVRTYKRKRINHHTAPSIEYKTEANGYVVWIGEGDDAKRYTVTDQQFEFYSNAQLYILMAEDTLENLVCTFVRDMEAAGDDFTKVFVVARSYLDRALKFIR